MAKQLLGNGRGSYTFNASAKTITFSNLDIQLFEILLINNVTRETIIYNPFVSGKGYTSFSDNVLTLEFDTTTYANTDILQIFYDNSESQQTAITDLSLEIKNLVNIIAHPTYMSPAGEVRISGALTGVTTISTVSTVTNVNTIGNISTHQMFLDPAFLTSYVLVRDRFL